MKSFLKLLKLSFLIFTSIYSQNIFANAAFFGKISSIPVNIQKMMVGNTWHKGCPVALNQLSYLQLSYWGFDNKPHIGELIVHQKVAIEVLGIFKQLYTAHFPIEKMQLPEKLAIHKKFAAPLALMEYSEASDNTSAFFCRVDTQNPKHVSAHSFGIAIDINPFYNPAVAYQGKSEPLKASNYLNRTIKHIGMIFPNDIVFNSFLHHGWVWGGFYAAGANYMHFQKVITPYYTVNYIKYVPLSKGISNLPKV